jgi:sterol 3beta-glucosyltransferase
MRIGLQTWGSHGDVRPFLALAHGLHAAGHAVTLAVTCVDSARYAVLAPRLPFRLEDVASPVVGDRAELARIGRELERIRNPARQPRRMFERILLPAEEAMFEAAERLCAGHDLVVGHHVLHPLQAAADRHGRDWAAVALAPVALPSAYRPPMGLPDLGHAGNRLAWRAARFVLDHGMKRDVDRMRARHGLAPAGDLLDRVWNSPQLTLLACSPVLCPPAPDWPAHVHVSGALDLAAPVEGGVPPALERFLADGPPPAYLTFGSLMAGSDLRETVALLVEAARRAGLRAVVQAPGWEAAGLRADDDVLLVESAAHGEVFPRCALVVHHGGAGTSHAALRAGVPSVVVAHIPEQAMWAGALRRAGVGGRPLWRRGLTARRLADAIAQVAASDAMARRARTLGARVAREDGVATAVRLIEQRFAGASGTEDRP